MRDYTLWQNFKYSGFISFIINSILLLISLTFSQEEVLSNLIFALCLFLLGWLLIFYLSEKQEQQNQEEEPKVKLITIRKEDYKWKNKIK